VPDSKRRTIALLFAAVTVAAFVSLALFYPGKGIRMKRASVGVSAPDFELKDMAGNAWRLSSLEGTPVLVNFWATWCASCRQEMPSLQRLFERTKTMRIVTVIYRDDPGNAAEFMRLNNYTMPVLIDMDGSVSSAYGLTGVPETFIVDKKGVLREKLIGPVEFDSPEALDFFDALQRE